MPRGDVPNNMKRGRGRPRRLTPALIEEIASAVRVNNRLDAAAYLAGIDRDTCFAWLKDGARLRQAVSAGTRTWGSLTRDEKLLAEYSDSMSQAVAISERNLNGGITLAGAQTSVETRTTRRIVGTRQVQTGIASDGTPLIGDAPVYAEEVVTVERPPDWKAAAWLLERRHPGWTVKQQVELSGPEGGPISLEARAAQASERLRELKDQRNVRQLGPAPEGETA